MESMMDLESFPPNLGIGSSIKPIKLAVLARMGDERARRDLEVLVGAENALNLIEDALNLIRSDKHTFDLALFHRQGNGPCLRTGPITGESASARMEDEGPSRPPDESNQLGTAPEHSCLYSRQGNGPSSRIAPSADASSSALSGDEGSSSQPDDSDGLGTALQRSSRLPSRVHTNPPEDSGYRGESQPSSPSHRSNLLKASVAIFAANCNMMVSRENGDTALERAVLMACTLSWMLTLLLIVASFVVPSLSYTKAKIVAGLSAFMTAFSHLVLVSMKFDSISKDTVLMGSLAAFAFGAAIVFLACTTHKTTSGPVALEAVTVSK